MNHNLLSRTICPSLGVARRTVVNRAARSAARSCTLFSWLALAGMGLAAAVVAGGENESQKQVVYAPLSAAEARSKSLAWIEEHAPEDPDLRQAVEDVWTSSDIDASVDARSSAVMQTFYLANPEVRELVDACLQQPVWMLPPSFAALKTTEFGPFHENNVRAFFARYLAVAGAHDAALAQFELIDPDELVDPAGYLFYRAVCEHGLLLKEEGLRTIARLLEQTENLPDRYRSVASLMQADLAQVEPKSLGEVARQMQDVRRRLSLGHGGPRVQEVEERIIATLDELIEKLESQQGDSSSSSSAGGQGAPPSNQSQSPMQDSQIGGGKGPGEVDPKDLGKGNNWGQLPDKAQTDAKNLINRQFPQHYRQAVEEYLQKLAERAAPRR
ncbi:MAG: hypothetical protein KF861_05235 [Planctomycetaceae bacterium]|nr:hypothetical protein [Planctomycetaceae bacterium]